MNKLLIILTLSLFLNLNAARSQEWGVDRFERKQRQEQAALDSILVKLKNNWEIKVMYGRWFFTQVATPAATDLFAIPGSMNNWQLSTAWHFSEKLFADFTIGVQVEKSIPERPNIISVLNGDDIQVEGYGAVFIPVEFGLKYYLTKGRFRPLVGLSNGFLTVKSQYIFAEGNINNGISPSEQYEFTNRVWLGKVNAGFDYRLGKNSSFSLQGSYYTSSPFDSAVGGYTAYQGLLFNTGFAVVF